MTPGEIIALIMIVLVISCASGYIAKSRRSGKKCIGCPFADSCAKKHGACDAHAQAKWVGEQEEFVSPLQQQQNNKR